jgi:hypothetical protein
LGHAANNDRRFQFQKRSHYFIRVHNEPLSVATVRINNPVVRFSAKVKCFALTRHRSLITYHF